jgi:hypothetical protein
MYESIPVVNATTGALSITLRETAQGFDEMVLVGYGTQERTDVTGTSAFGLGSEFGFFRGASLGWRISEGSFIKDIPAISNLKVRGGYGNAYNSLNSMFLYTWLSSTWASPTRSAPTEPSTTARRPHRAKMPRCGR